MWILFRLFLALFGILYRLFGHKFRKIQLVKAENGLEYQTKKSVNKKKQITQVEIIIPLETKLFFRLVPEKNWHKWCKTIGLASEIQTGDSEFDQMFYVESDHPAFLKKIRSETTLVNSLKKLSEIGFKKITSDGRGYLSLETETQTKEIPENTILDALLNLKQQIESIKVSFTDVDPYAIRYFILELIFLFCAGYAFGTYLDNYIDERVVHLDPWGLEKTGILIGLTLFVCWNILAIILLRSSSRAPKLLSEFFIFLLLSLTLGGGQAMMDLNMALDKSSPVVTVAKILEKKRITTGSGKNRRTKTYLILDFDKNPLDIPGELKVSSWDSYGLTQGQGVKISTRDGFFHSPYIENLESCAPPEVKTQEELVINENKELIEIVNWNPEIEDMRFVKLNWKEEKYPSGKIRSREPYIHGKKNGLASYWHENGELYSNIPWKNDRKEGRFNLYREDGSLEQSLNYKDGEPHGLLSWFDAKENLKQRAIYKNGVQIQVDQRVLNDLDKTNH